MLKFAIVDRDEPRQLKQILELVREHELSEFEIEHDGLRLGPQGRGRGARRRMPPPAVPAARASPAAAPRRRPGDGRCAARSRRRPPS